jgi:tetratricopeptide (TPR) repeat protein
MLASALLSRSLFTGSVQDGTGIDDAVALAEEAVRNSNDGHYTYATVRTVAAQAHVHRYRVNASSRDLDEAFSYYWNVITTPHATPAGRLGAAAELATCAWSEGRTDEALAAYRHAVELLPIAAWRGIDRSAREWMLTHWSGLACDAAATATAAGRVDEALELSESGRGVLWSQLLDTRTDIGALRAGHPELAERLDSIRRDLDASVATATSGAQADLIQVVKASTRQIEMRTGTRT